MRIRSPRSSATVLGTVAVLLLSACGGAAAGSSAGPTSEAATTGEMATSDATPAPTAAAASGMEVTVTHAQGETTVPVAPETVVVFDLGTLDSMNALGIEADGVPETATLPDSIQQYATDDHPKVGSVFEPDYEAVNALGPDLIIVAGRSSSVYPDLAEIAPTVDLTVDNADFLGSFEERIMTLATIFGVEDRAQQRLDAIHAEAQEVSAYGPGSRFGIIHDVLGVGPAAEGLDPATHGDAVSFEFILEQDPDLLYVIDRDSAVGEGGETAQQILDNEIVSQTTAWRNDDVFYLDPATWYLAPNGLGSVESMIAEVRASVE